MRYMLLAIVLLLSSCDAQTPPRSASEVQPFVALAERGVHLAQSVEAHASRDDIQSLLRQLVESARGVELRTRNSDNQGDSTTIRGMDAMAAAKVLACARSEALEVTALSDRMPTYIQLKIASAAGECAALATEYLRTVRDQDIADDVGFAVVMAYPVAIAAAAQVGFQTRALLDGFRDASEAIVVKLAPECHRAWRPDLKQWTLETHYECVAYNGASARGPNRESVAAQATGSTSRGVATAVLAMMSTAQRR